MNNGKTHSGPPFAVVGPGGITMMPMSAIVETLEKNATIQAKDNLAAGPVFRQMADRFREWGKTAEPGWMCHSPEVGFTAIRLASNTHVATFLSDGALQRMKDDAAKVAALPDPPMEAELPRIFRP